MHHSNRAGRPHNNIPFTINQRHEKGPFDIIGDVHGCFDELHELLLIAGYDIRRTNTYSVTHPENRKIIFVGDLVDRGPKTPEVLRLVINMIESGTALCVNGNHDDKLKRKLKGNNVKISHGLEESLAQLEHETAAFKEEIINFLSKLPSHYVLDEGKLAVSHAGLKMSYIGKDSRKVQAFCKYGQTTGEVDELGLPIRYPWPQEYEGDTLIIYGHTPVLEPSWVNNTLNIDTGCVFGGKLTAFRYPEKQFLFVPAAKTYHEPMRAPL